MFIKNKHVKEGCNCFLKNLNISSENLQLFLCCLLGPMDHVIEPINMVINLFYNIDWCWIHASPIELLNC